MDQIQAFAKYVDNNITKMREDREFLGLSNIWIQKSIRHNYAQNFMWLGRPVVQVPQDIYAYQELIWAVKPDLVIETGVAHGGSLILTASMLALLDYCEAVEKGESFNPRKSNRRVIGIDIDIRAHNRFAIEHHPMHHLVQMIEGSSVEQPTIDKVMVAVDGYSRIFVSLDSNHTHDHVLAELEAYAPLTSQGSYCIVWDTGVEDLPPDFCMDRPWGKGNNPKTAVYEYMRRIETEKRVGIDGNNLAFEIDKTIETKLMITAAPDGFLKRI